MTVILEVLRQNGKSVSTWDNEPLYVRDFFLCRRKYFSKKN